jgi:hypothetical protein
MTKGGVREGGRVVERRGGCAGSFFVGVCDDIDPTDRFGWTLAPSTGGQGFWIVQHVAESCRKGERAKRRDDLLSVASESATSLSEARELIDGRQDVEPLVDEGGNVRGGWVHDGGRGRVRDLDGQGRRGGCTRTARPLKT